MSFNSSLLFPFILFCFATFYTPGPNNVMLLSAGLNFGLRRSLSTVFGVDVGYAFLGLCVGAGLGAVFTAYPMIYTILKYAGALYMLYLAWMIATSAPPNAAELDANITSGKKPVGFFRAAALQWVNPKGWVMAVGAIATYGAIAAYPYNVLLITLIFSIVGIGSSLFWACLGSLLQKFLHRPKIVRAFNIAMAILLVLSLYPIFAEAFR